MSEPLDLDYLDAIEARAFAATQGPWHSDHNNLEFGAYGCVSIGDHGWVCSGANTPAYDVDSEQGRDDAEFIAHARTDVPALLAEVRRLRRLAHRIAGRIEDAGGPGSVKWSRMVRQFLNEGETS